MSDPRFSPGTASASARPTTSERQAELAGGTAPGSPATPSASIDTLPSLDAGVSSPLQRGGDPDEIHTLSRRTTAAEDESRPGMAIPIHLDSLLDRGSCR